MLQIIADSHEYPQTGDARDVDPISQGRYLQAEMSRDRFANGVNFRGFESARFSALSAITAVRLGR
jgi:hypothetical protein